MRSMNRLPSSVRTRDGLSLRLRHWPAGDQSDRRGTILLVHGLGEHIGRYERLAEMLRARGWFVTGYDQRGHGLSDGKRGVLSQSDDLLHDLASVLDSIGPGNPNGKTILLGHSLGGLVVARFVTALASPIEDTSWQRAVDLCVLSSPALALDLSIMKTTLIKTLGAILPSLALSNGLNPDWLCTDAATVENYRNDPLVHNRISGRLALFMIEAIATVMDRTASWRTPTLLLYSGDDRCVAPSGSTNFATDAPASLVESHVYAKLRHEILNEPEDAGVYSTLFDWLEKHDSPGSFTGESAGDLLGEPLG